MLTVCFKTKRTSVSFALVVEPACERMMATGHHALAGRSSRQSAGAVHPIIAEQ